MNLLKLNILKKHLRCTIKFQMISVGAGVLQTIHDLNATAVRHAPYGSVGNVPVRPSPVSRIPRRTSGSVRTNTLPFLPFAFALNFYAKSALFYFSFFTLSTHYRARAVSEKRFRYALRRYLPLIVVLRSVSPCFPFISPGISSQFF